MLRYCVLLTEIVGISDVCIVASGYAETDVILLSGTC
jgi:hypothetical protein